MNIQLEKQALIKKIEETNDFSIIESIKAFFVRKESASNEDLSQAQIEELELSLKEFDNGEYSDFESFISPYLRK